MHLRPAHFGTVTKEVTREDFLENLYIEPEGELPDFNIWEEDKEGISYSYGGLRLIDQTAVDQLKPDVVFSLYTDLVPLETVSRQLQNKSKFEVIHRGLNCSLAPNLRGAPLNRVQL